MNTHYFNAQLIKDGIYLGSIDAANDEQWLRKNNIKGVVGIVNGQHRYDGISYIVYNDIGDSQNQNIIKIFHDTFKFMDNIVDNKGNLLVHCHAGISRSTTIVLGYMMYKWGYSLFNAFEYVKIKRSIIFPNYGFLSQLMVFDRLTSQQKREWLDISGKNKV